MTIAALFRLILPVFALIAVGAAIRRCKWIDAPAEASLIRLVVYVCMPCLVFDTIVGNSALREPGNLFLPPLVGFVTTAVGIGVGYFAARRIGLEVGTGLRTFALTVGICNYSYLPLPIVGALWGEQTKGVVLVHNVGVDTAIWSVGLLVLTGASPREGWRRLVTPLLITLVVSVAINVSGASAFVPGFIASMAHSLGVCAVPLGLVVAGVSVADFLDEPGKLLHRNVAVAACVVRLGILPVFMLCLARWLPCSIELKRVIVVQSAMPAGMIPIVIARYYGGQPLTSVQVILATTALGLVTCPLWIRAGLAWAGVA
jgi:malate permease and related proteins